VILGCRMMPAIDAFHSVHTGRIFSLRMLSPVVRADLDVDYGRVMAVGRVMGGLNSIEIEVLLLLFSDATYNVKPPTIIPRWGSNQPCASPSAGGAPRSAGSYVLSSSPIYRGFVSRQDNRESIRGPLADRSHEHHGDQNRARGFTPVASVYRT
jgi:hypothetical protein